MSLVVALVGAIALGACGGADVREERNTYVRQLNAAQQEFAANATVVARRTSPATIGEYRRTLQRFESTIANFTTTLRNIKVPEPVGDEHAQLIDALTNFAVDFKRAAGTLNNPNARAVDEAKRAIAAATQRANVRIDAAAAAIDSKLQDT
jgi:hypothetical protein